VIQDPEREDTTSAEYERLYGLSDADFQKMDMAGRAELQKAAFSDPGAKHRRLTAVRAVEEIAESPGMFEEVRKTDEYPGQRLAREALAKADGADKINLKAIHSLGPALGLGGLESLMALAKAWALANDQAGDDETILERYLNTATGRKVLAAYLKAAELLVKPTVQ
jgi:hypothetical protein